MLMQCVIAWSCLSVATGLQETDLSKVLVEKKKPASLLVKEPILDPEIPVSVISGIMFDRTNEQAFQKHLLQPSTTSRHALMAYKLRLLLALDF